MALTTRIFRGLSFVFLFLILFGLAYWVSQGTPSPTARGGKEILTPSTAAATVATTAVVSSPPAPRQVVHPEAETVREVAKTVPYAPTTDSSEEEMNADSSLLEARNNEELRIRRLRNGGQ